MLQNCDLWIHQDIRIDNEYGYYLSDEYIRSCIKESASEIIVPNLFGLGKLIFPQSDKNSKYAAIANGKDRNGMFPLADRIIDMCVEKGMGKEEILEMCLTHECFNKNEILDNLRTYIDKIEKREENWDIKISDFILKNYRKEKFFYDSGHPTNEIIKEICMQILGRLGMHSEEICCNWCLDNHEEPVYPYVKKALGLNWEGSLIRKSKYAKKASDRMWHQEYIEEYLWRCYGM